MRAPAYRTGGGGDSTAVLLVAWARCVGASWRAHDQARVRAWNRIRRRHRTECGWTESGLAVATNKRETSVSGLRAAVSGVARAARIRIVVPSRDPGPRLWAGNRLFARQDSGAPARPGRTAQPLTTSQAKPARKPSHQTGALTISVAPIQHQVVSH